MWVKSNNKAGNKKVVTGNQWWRSSMTHWASPAFLERASVTADTSWSTSSLKPFLSDKVVTWWFGLLLCRSLFVNCPENESVLLSYCFWCVDAILVTTVFAKGSWECVYFKSINRELFSCSRYAVWVLGEYSNLLLSLLRTVLMGTPPSYFSLGYSDIILPFLLLRF